MALFSALDWPIRLLVAVVVAGGLGTGGYLIARTSGDEEPPAIVLPDATPTATRPAATATTAPEPTQRPVTATQPPATALQPTPIPRLPTLANDTREAITEAPLASEIQLGSDGKYFVADRGDGCEWHEYLRMNQPGIGTEVYLRTDCPVDFAFTYRPDSGLVLRLVP